MFVCPYLYLCVHVSVLVCVHAIRHQLICIIYTRTCKYMLSLSLSHTHTHTHTHRSVSACQVPKERRERARRGIKYSLECLAITQASASTAAAHTDKAKRGACAHALHLLGYHCAEFASGGHRTSYLEQASIALLNSQKIFKELEDDEMTATTLQDLGLCYYYQHRYKEAMALYTSACRVIVEKLGPCHVALACPAFNIANIMCAAGTYERAIDFYKIAYSINVQALGKVGRPSALLVTRSCHSVSLVLLAKPLY